MWDQQYDDELSDAGNSDEPDSDIEALLYSKVHYEAEDLGATEAAQAPALLTGDLASGLASAVAKGKASSKRRERGDAERLKVLEGASAAKRKKKRKLEVIVEEDGGDGSAEDRDASSVDAVDTIVLSSDDELIVFSEESSQDISLNVEGTTETNKSQGKRSALLSKKEFSAEPVMQSWMRFLIQVPHAILHCLYDALTPFCVPYKTSYVVPHFKKNSLWKRPLQGILFTVYAASSV